MKALRSSHFKRLICIAALITLLATLWIGSAPEVTAEGPVTPTPSITTKNEPAVSELNMAEGGSFVASPPGPSSKNHQGETASVRSAGTARAIAPGPSSKNYGGSDGDSQSTTALDDITATAGSFTNCGASGSTNWTTTSGTFKIIHQCTLTVPQDGWVFVSTNASLARQDGEYEAQFRIDIDSNTGDPDIDRWVNVYDDAGDGTAKSVALSVLKPVSAGEHTFYSLGRRSAGPGTVLVYDPTLSVMFIPSAGATTLPCGASGNLNWTTTSGTFQVIRQCTLTVPQDGWAFISTDASLARQDGEYEAQFRIDIDRTSGDPDIDRWVNVYDDSGDGTDESVALSVLKPVTAGEHTFYSLGRRSAGPGTVLVYDPTINVIYIPATNAKAVPCGASGNLDWTTTSGTFQVIRQCTLTVPQDGWAFISTDASLARQDGEYEAQFRIDIDRTSGDPDIDRWVNIYNDGGDGTDKSVALSVLKPVTAGEHTFYSLGRRSAGPGTVLVYDPTLTALVPIGPYVPAKGIQDIIDTIKESNLDRGIENSLLAKLDAALKVLDDSNNNNDVAAINTLQAFINAVEAQRGKALTNEQADQLILMAQAVLDSLS